MSKAQILQGHAINVLKELESESVHCCVTSPPFWGLRDYGVGALVWGGDLECVHQWGDEIRVSATNHVDKRRWNHTRNGRDELQPKAKRVGWTRQLIPQGKFCSSCGAWAGSLGLEPTPELYVDHIVDVFREVRRALRKDGTLWLNMGDCYATGAGKVGERPGGGKQGERWAGRGMHSKDAKRAIGPISQPNRMPLDGLKPKDLVGMPWRVAFALQADGWWLRSDIIWSKANPMPESVRDRPTKSHEYLFLLSKSERYYYDADAISEPCSKSTHARISQDLAAQVGSFRANGGSKTNGPMRAVVAGSTRKLAQAGTGIKNNASFDGALQIMPTTRNRRSVWNMNTVPYKGAHFATFPPKLIEPCVLAGCPEGGTVLDCFSGSGTTLAVAVELGRDAIGIDLKGEYNEMARERVDSVRAKD